MPNFLVEPVQKIIMAKIKLFNVTTVNFEFILNDFDDLDYKYLQNYNESWS